ncbi:hypothetical protein PHPALM_30537 [Phytophthora palmivora]|uniref:Uncharacterized protein n=1 Tax=Phytophthora palmivora TaxID=4796 RepID=A0A2P4X4W4_9STRA|nr:hypothetical protein PHPALM_30537 [Phytophthora palmivora]
MLRLPGIKARLRALHVRRPEFVTPCPSADPVEAEVPWPAHVKSVEECEDPEDIAIRASVLRLLYEYMQKRNTCYLLHSRLINAASTLHTLKRFDTGRVGLGVFTTTFLEVGVIVGEYVWRLCEYAVLVKGQPLDAMK